MKITKACDYAVRSLIYMAKVPSGTVFMRSELSEATKVPGSFLGKILQNLAKSGILISERGKKGGFRLERNLEDISMYDIILAIEGEMQITDCLADESYCDQVDFCKVHRVWCEIQGYLNKKLSSTKLSDLL